jgi:sigma-B regulation protein RsbU (phosphoserine phosphatase)
MTETLLLEPGAKRKPMFRRWKWIGLACFAAVLIFRPWLPGVVVVLGYVYGIVVIANLVFLFSRYLKNRIFWRVRNRILGSFIFVGLIPLLLLLGTIYLAAYLLVGQLAANYLETSLSEIVREITGINVELAQQVTAIKPAAALDESAQPVFKRHEQQFPRMWARLAHKKPAGGYEIAWTYDPAKIAPQSSEYPAERWLASKEAFEGVLRLDKSAYMTSIRAVPRMPEYILEVTAPLDAVVEQRLEAEKSIFAMFEGTGRSTLTTEKSGIQVKIGTGRKDDEAAKAIERRTLSLEERSKKDPRRMIWWWSLLDSKNYKTGEKDFAAFSMLYVPLEVLYRTYLTGRYNQGEVLLRLIYVLLGAFAFAELVSVIIGLTISRRITRSIHDMHQGTIALQKGDLQHRIPVRRSDQLGLLAHSFNQMSASITRLLEEVSEKKRLEQELEIAREVQATLFPKQLPQARGLSVFGGCEPARVVSGDYYDFILEDETRLHIVVADISGKGISAALLMANLQAAMRNQLMTLKHAGSEEIEQSLAEVMRRLNHQIYLNSPSEKYVTMFSSRYDAETRRLYYCNAGHLPPILLSNGELSRLETGGTVLGLFESARYQASSIEMHPGAVLALYTDGITEAVNGADEEFGEERLLEALRRSSMHPPESIYNHVTGQVREWQGELKQHDDITLIVAKVT